MYDIIFRPSAKVKMRYHYVSCVVFIQNQLRRKWTINFSCITIQVIIPKVLINRDTIG